MLNCIEVSKYINDPKGLSKLSQVGVDLTIESIKKVIEPNYYSNTPTMSGIFINKTYINPSSYISVASRFVKFESKGPELEVFYLDAGVYSVTFDQGLFKLPNNITALLRHRSSLLRIGGCIPGGVYDPGFEVEQIGAMMTLNLPVVLEKHSRIAQMTMHHNTPVPDENMYTGQYQGTKDIK